VGGDFHLQERRPFEDEDFHLPEQRSSVGGDFHLQERRLSVDVDSHLREQRSSAGAVQSRSELRPKRLGRLRRTRLRRGRDFLTFAW
jgi:hypothetical protein